jgi:hypothetical protein
MTYKEIPGYCNYHWFYDRIFYELPENFTMAEVGVWFGHSVAYMAHLAKQERRRCRIFAVDTFEGSPKERKHQEIVKQHGGSIYKAFENNMKACGVASYIYPVVNDSAFAPGYIAEMMDFVFLDAEHEYMSVKQDIVSWWPWVKKGGVIAGHDYVKAWPGVCQAVDELIPGREVELGVWSYVKKEDKLPFI